MRRGPAGQERLTFGVRGHEELNEWKGRVRVRDEGSSFSEPAPDELEPSSTSTRLRRDPSQVVSGG